MSIAKKKNRLKVVASSHFEDLNMPVESVRKRLRMDVVRQLLDVDSIDWSYGCQITFRKSQTITTDVGDFPVCREEASIDYIVKGDSENE